MTDIEVSKDHFVVNDLVLRITNIDSRQEELVAILTSNGFSVSSAELFPKVYTIGDKIILKKDYLLATNELIASSIIVPKIILPQGITCEIYAISASTLGVHVNFVGEARALDLLNKCECSHRFSVEDLVIPTKYFL